ncbi:hypothetical protein B0T18DRAFT_183751 [Schizothecium vesticola]|uniref:Uncharacterized protein n=1 Tax=Schizothecium vesticola TaxID=314040 RepID=A0AA40EQ42_9PEZI|nr:hypothetical protein B0T18DRAFT_183751 [Schizothecium vesticola]
MLSVPGVGRLSVARDSALGGMDAAGVTTVALPLSCAFSAAFFAVPDLWALSLGAGEGATAGCDTFGVPRAGKSSSCSAFCNLAFAMSLERPLSTASVLISFFASGAEETGGLLLVLAAGTGVLLEDVGAGGDAAAAFLVTGVGAGGVRRPPLGPGPDETDAAGDA